MGSCARFSLRDVVFDAGECTWSYAHTRIRFGAYRGTRVAVKQASLVRAAREETSAAACARLRAEAAALRVVGRHPGIVRLLALDEAGDEGLVSLVTEECAAGTLGAPGLPLRSLRALGELAAALAHVHARGVVHRDVKPCNVLLKARSGAVQVRLSDFDRATRAGASLALGGGALSVGTMLFMAPELLRAEAAAGEAAAGEAAPALPAVPALDAYSFGITAFQVIERREPYQHLNLAPGCPDSLSRLDFGHAVAARGLRPAWDPHLEIEEGAAALAEARELVELCWAPEPAERPPMARLAEALRTASTLAMYKYF
jgi:serine/threonine protein kinase